MANVVLKPDGSRMSNPELRRQFVRGMSPHVRDLTPIYPHERLDGSLCACAGHGEFLLLPYEPGQKRYMVCRRCDGFSHL